MNGFEEHPRPADAAGLDDAALERLLVEAGPPPPTPEIEIRLIEEAARTAWRRQYTWRQRRRRAVGWGFAAVAAVLIGLVALFGLRAQAPAEAGPAPRWATLERLEGALLRSRDGQQAQALATGDEIAIGSELRTDATSRAVLLLAGGQTGWLDRETTVRIASAERLELASGAIYLDSGGDHDPATGARAAITVVTSSGSFREVGTQFEVRIDASGSGSRLSVRAGSVLFESGDRAQAVGPLEVLSIGSDGSLTRHAVAGYGPEWSWVIELAPLPEIEGSTLQSFLLWYARQSGRSIEYADPESARSAHTTRLHGSVAGLDPHQAMRVVLASSGFEIEESAATLRVSASEDGR